MDGKLPSRHQVGDVAYFQPSIKKADTKKADDSAIPCKVVAVKFNGAKVLYDLALPDGDGGFYDVLPLCGVDSYFVLRAPAEL